MKRFVCAALLTLCAGAVQAESCAQKISRLEKRIHREPAAATTPGVSLPESTDAKLHHQPTMKSVAKAKQQSDADTLDDARLLDAEGKEKACRDKIKPLEK